MNQHAEKIYEELLIGLEALDQNPSEKRIAPDPRLQLLTNAIEQLKQKLKTHEFANDDEEIYFFKNILPRFLSLYIYYTEKIFIECSERTGTQKSKEAFLEHLFEKIDYFFKTNDEFFNYYRFEKTRFDKFYFLRNRTLEDENPGLPLVMMDLSFCTIHSWKLSMIIAYTRLEKEIQFKSFEQTIGAPALVPGALNENSAKQENIRLEWTDPNMGLVELIYSLKEKGAFNHGKADLKSIAKCFEQSFGVKFSNLSKSFQDLLSRKKSYSSYLDKLREELNRGIDEIEDRNMR
jgi:RteC protein